MPGRSEATLLLMLMGSLIVGQADSGEPLTRRKRYVVFPEGSSFSVALCMTVHTLTPDNIFTEGLNWGISYDLPNESKPELAPLLEFRKDQLGRRPVQLDKPKNDGQKYQVYPAIDGTNNNNYADYRRAPGNEAAAKYKLLADRKKYTKADYYYLQRRHRRDLYNKLEVVINAMGFDGRSCVLRALCEAARTLLPRGNSLVEEMMRIVFSLPLKRVFSFEPEEHRVYAEAHKAGHEGQDCPLLFPGCSFSLIDMALGKYSVAAEEAEEEEDRRNFERYTMK